MTTADLDDDGFFHLEYRRADAKDAPPVKLTLDAVEVLEALRRIAMREVDAAEAEGRTVDTATPMRDWLNEKYKLGCSGLWAVKLYDRLRTEVARLQKKDPSPNSAEIPKPSDFPSGPTDQPATPPA